MSNAQGQGILIGHGVIAPFTPCTPHNAPNVHSARRIKPKISILKFIVGVSLITAEEAERGWGQENNG